MVNTAVRRLAQGLLPLLGVAPVWACDTARLLTLRAGIVSQSSVWDEFAITGTHLLRETGRLSGPSAHAQWACERWSLGLGLEQVQGTRDYDGQTNVGTPLQTTSRLQQTSGYAQLAYAPAAGWRLGVRYAGTDMSRDIASTPTVSGYPEYYEWRMLSVGGEWNAETTVGTLGVGVWVGQTMDSAMRVQLPGRDSNSLSLGTIQQSQLDLRWARAYGAQWSAHVALGYRWTEIGQGAPSVITNHGVPVGSAYQPRATLREVPLSVALQYQF